MSSRGIILLAASASWACGEGASNHVGSGGSAVANAGNATAGAPGGGAPNGGTPSTGGLSAGGADDCPAPSPAATRDDLTTFPQAAVPAPTAHQYFRINVRSEGAPVRGARLRTVHEVELVSDDDGVVAFYEPGLMGREVYFSVSHPGYELAADAFGNRGKAFTATEGATGELTLTKTTGQLPAARGDLDSRLAAGPAPAASSCFALRVYDDETKRGVPLVKVSVLDESLWSDSQGIVAYCNPDRLPGPATAFQVWSHGYALADGATSVTLDAAVGGRAEVPLRRQNLAERLYRLTGGGIYRDSVLLGLSTPLQKPNLNASVLGQDTASVTTYRGKLFWLWQDTDRASYPLGNFRSTAATSPLPSAPYDQGVDLSYIENDAGFSAEMCPDCMGGPAWLDGLFSVHDAAGEERLFGGYTVVNGSGAALEQGMVRFDDASQHFERVVTDFTERAAFDRPSSHPFEVWHGGERYAYYDNRLRIPAEAEAFLDPAEYERFTPYAAGESTPAMTSSGAPAYAWRAAGLRADSERLTASGFGPEHALDGHLKRHRDGGDIELVGVSATYHPYRGRFLLVGQQRFGATSAIGEIWQAEADTPLGPWLYAAQLITHDDYTFYNVLYHPELARGPFAYFEGTYTATYSGAKELTPRYDYNQLLYRVDLSRPELALPVAVYDLAPAEHTRLVTKRELRAGAPALAATFLAYDAPAPSALAVAATEASCRPARRLELTGSPKTTPLFYALPPSTQARADLVPLYEWAHPDGRHAYALEGSVVAAGFVRAATPLALVFENPVKVELPVADYLAELIADAGPDQCVTSTGASTTVELDASTSTSRGTVTRYLWRVPGSGACEYVEGARLSRALPPGIHELELEVTDDAGRIAHDTVTVSIQ